MPLKMIWYSDLPFNTECDKDGGGNDLDDTVDTRCKEGSTGSSDTDGLEDDWRVVGDRV